MDICNEGRSLTIIQYKQVGNDKQLGACGDLSVMSR